MKRAVSFSGGASRVERAAAFFFFAVAVPGGAGGAAIRRPGANREPRGACDQRESKCVQCAPCAKMSSTTALSKWSARRVLGAALGDAAAAARTAARAAFAHDATVAAGRAAIARSVSLRSRRFRARRLAARYRAFLSSPRHWRRHGASKAKQPSSEREAQSEDSAKSRICCSISNCSALRRFSGVPSHSGSW